MTPAPDNPLERKRDRFKRLFLGDRADQANAQASTCQSDVLIEKGDHSAPSAIQQATEPTAVKGNVSKSPEDPSKDDNVSQVAEVEAGQVLSPTALRFQESFGSDDIWSAAYREAILTFDSSQRSLLLAGSRETFFQLMENLQGDVGGGSTLSRGLLHMKGPLERLNMALDVAKPLTSLEPTQALSTAVGIVQTVIKMAIGVCGLVETLKAEITNMLDHIAIIDRCETATQNRDQARDVHKALVSVYKDLAGFYLSVIRILSNESVQCAIGLTIESFKQEIPAGIAAFVKDTSMLQNCIQVAVLGVVGKLEDAVVASEVRMILGINNDRRRCNDHATFQAERADAACQWITNDLTFTGWLDAVPPASPVLAIYGDTGCGKSYLTSFLIDFLHEKLWGFPKTAVYFHYCKSEKDAGTASGILSGLLYQLLQQHVSLNHLFKAWYEKQSGVVLSVQAMAEFFKERVRSLKRRSFIVIDGLDECDNATKGDLVKILTSICEETRCCRVIVVARPQERLKRLLCNAAQVNIKPSEDRDRIIVEHAVRSLSLQDKARQELVDGLSKAAVGNVIWVKMMVKLVETRNLTAPGPIRKLLRAISCPQELLQVYSEIFQDAEKGDSDNEAVITTALEILAVARRPLKLSELDFAVALDAANRSGPSPSITSIDALEEYTDQNRVLALIRPFVTTSSVSDGGDVEVRLVHASLREAVLQYPPSSWGSDRLSRDDGREAVLERRLLALCAQYLLFDEFNELDLFSSEQQDVDGLNYALPGSDVYEEGPEDGLEGDDAAATETASADRSFDPRDQGFGGFFVYASCYWLDHLKFYRPTTESNLSAEALVTLARANSKRMQNWVEQYCRPECTVKKRFNYFAESVDPLVLIATFGSEELLRWLLSHYDPLDDAAFLPKSVQYTVNSIFQDGYDLGAVEVLFHDPHTGPELQTFDFFYNLIGSWSKARFVKDRRMASFDKLFDLIKFVSDTLETDNWANELLCIAAAHGCSPMVERLFQMADPRPSLRDQLLEARDRGTRPFRHQSIGDAVWGGQPRMVEWLLKQPGIDAHLRHVDKDGWNVFHMSTQKAQPEILELLIPRFKEGVHQHDKNGETPLTLLIFGNRHLREQVLKCAKLIIELGEVNLQDEGLSTSTGQSALSEAVRAKDLPMVKLLVQLGKANPNTALVWSETGQPSLRDHWAYQTQDSSSSTEEGEMIRLLVSLAKDSLPAL